MNMVKADSQRERERNELMTNKVESKTYANS